MFINTFRMWLETSSTCSGDVNSFPHSTAYTSCDRGILNKVVNKRNAKVSIHVCVCVYLYLSIHTHTYLHTNIHTKVGEPFAKNSTHAFLQSGPMPSDGSPHLHH